MMKMKSQVKKNRTKAIQELLRVLNLCYPDDYGTEDFALDKIAKEVLTSSTRSVGTEPYKWIE